MNDIELVTSPDDPALDRLCDRLAQLAREMDRTESWPAEQLRLCNRAGVCQWFAERRWGGQQWTNLDITRGYLRLSAACLTTTFITTQRIGAYQRIAAGSNQAAKERLLPGLVSGHSFATIGISHLTTSRRHLAKPVLEARETADGFVLNGFSPWVTGGPHADTIVVGAVLDSGAQILVALPTSLSGVTIDEPARLVGLAASHTGQVRVDNVRVGREWLLAGPVESVTKIGSSAGTGGLQTSTLAIGLASAALDFLEDEAQRRGDLVEAAREMRREHSELEASLLAIASGQAVCSDDQLRAAANSIALRTSQAALAAAKGTGYMVGHPAGRWCREALFFLVWSCPQGVMNANLCELAGLEI